MRKFREKNNAKILRKSTKISRKNENHATKKKRKFPEKPRIFNKRLQKFSENSLNIRAENSTSSFEQLIVAAIKLMVFTKFLHFRENIFALFSR